MFATLLLSAALLDAVFSAAPRSAQPIPASPRVVVVSLNDLERDTRAAVARGDRQVDAAALASLTDILGYRWIAARRDIELLGVSESSAPAIRRGVFGSAMRFADFPAIGMTLVPHDFSRGDSPHMVKVFPTDLMDSWLVEPLVAADYQVKKLAVAALADYHRAAIRTCAGVTDSSKEIATGRVIFLPAPPVLDLERGADGDVTVWIRRAGVVLTPERDLALADGSVRSALAPDPGLTAFVSQFNERFATYETKYPVFRQLEVAYKLVLLTKLLRVEEERLGWDASYWLSEYPLSKRPTPRELAGVGRQTVQHTCWGTPYEYSAARVERQIWGGVIIAYNPRLTDTVTGRPIPAAAGVSSSVSTTTRAPVGQTRSSLPDMPLGAAGDTTLALPHSDASAYPTLTFNLPRDVIGTLTPGFVMSGFNPAKLSALGSGSTSALTALPSPSLTLGSTALPAGLAGSQWMQSRLPVSALSSIALGTLRIPSLGWPSPPPPPPPPPRLPTCSIDFRGFMVCR